MLHVYLRYRLYVLITYTCVVIFHKKKKNKRNISLLLEKCWCVYGNEPISKFPTCEFYLMSSIESSYNILEEYKKNNNNKKLQKNNNLIALLTSLAI